MEDMTVQQIKNALVESGFGERVYELAEKKGKRAEWVKLYKEVMPS